MFGERVRRGHWTINHHLSRLCAPCFSAVQGSCVVLLSLLFSPFKSINGNGYKWQQ